MTLVEAVTDILTNSDAKGATVDGLYIHALTETGVLYLANRTREVNSDDVDAVRELLPKVGYREVKSWVATQGASWLHTGIVVGVSFQVEKVPA